MADHGTTTDDGSRRCGDGDGSARRASWRPSPPWRCSRGAPTTTAPRPRRPPRRSSPPPPPAPCRRTPGSASPRRWPPSRATRSSRSGPTSLVAADGSARLCDLLRESFPPQCGGAAMAVDRDPRQHPRRPQRRWRPALVGPAPPARRPRARRHLRERSGGARGGLSESIPACPPSTPTPSARPGARRCSSCTASPTPARATAGSPRTSFRAAACSRPTCGGTAPRPGTRPGTSAATWPTSSPSSTRRASRGRRWSPTRSEAWYPWSWRPPPRIEWRAWR